MKKHIILFQNGEVLNHADRSHHIIEFPDPRNLSVNRKYLFSSGHLHELQRVSPTSKSSWFFDQQVISGTITRNMYSCDIERNGDV